MYNQGNSEAFFDRHPDYWRQYRYKGHDRVSETIDAIYDYYETQSHSISEEYAEGEQRRRDNSLSPNFVMFIPDIRGALKVQSRSGRTSTVHLSNRNRSRYFEKVGERKSDYFVVTVGVLDDHEIHSNVFGYQDISYGLLFDLLKRVGYDPLMPIRKSSFISKIERKMGNVILNSINKRTPDSTTAIKAKLAAIARDVVDFARDYIRGGDKPSLSGKTISTRNHKDGMVDGLYEEGISEPLYESGQLCDAITFDVESYVSESKQNYFDRKKDAMKKRAESMKKRREQRRNKKREMDADDEDPYARLGEMVGRANDISTREGAMLESISAGRVREEHMGMVRASLRSLAAERNRIVQMAIAYAKKKGIPLEVE